MTSIIFGLFTQVRINQGRNSFTARRCSHKNLNTFNYSQQMDCEILKVLRCEVLIIKLLIGFQIAPTE